MPHAHRTLLVALCLAAAPLAAARAGEPTLTPSVDLEAGWAMTGRNDVRVPGDGGTPLSLAEGSLTAQSGPYVRLGAGLAYGRHHALVVFAPLRIQSSGNLADPISFAGELLGPGQATAQYRLDTYRLTYRYALLQGGRGDLQLGATALLRDVVVQLSTAQASASKSSVGFLPLASLRGAWRFAGPLSLVLDGDALATGKGRFEDVSLALELESGDLRFRGGYRLVEGVLDTASMYDAGLFHLVGVGVTYRF